MTRQPKVVAREQRKEAEDKKPSSVRINARHYPCVEGGALHQSVKMTSVLRRVSFPRELYYVKVPGLEGQVCAFELPTTSPTIFVESVSGRLQALVAGDVFLGTPGHRESNIVLVGGVPRGGLIPQRTYSVISDSGIVGQLLTGTQLARRFLTKVKYVGALIGENGGILSLKHFAVPRTTPYEDYGATVSLIVGTGPEVGKTTAGLAMLRTLLMKGYSSVIVLKATGTASFAEIANYRDHGASQVFDFVDFGLPSTYPSKRRGMERMFDKALDACLTFPADAVVIECGGDMLAANIPVFLRQLKKRRSTPRVVLAAADPLGAWGGTQILRKMGLAPQLITGPCTDTQASQQRTRWLCKLPAVNMARNYRNSVEETLWPRNLS